MFRTYDCPIDGCGYDTFDVKDVAHHLESEHERGGSDGDAEESSTKGAHEDQ